MMRRCILASVLVLIALVSARRAHADQGERIRLSYDAPPECPRETDFVGRVASFGEPVHPPLGPGAVRRFAVSIQARGAAPLMGKLVITDVWDEDTTREVSGKTCEDVASSLALFVALALEAPRDSWSPHAFAVREDEVDDLPPHDKENPDLGRGGTALGLLIGGSNANADAVERGLHARFAFHAPAHRSARYGVALQLTTDKSESWRFSNGYSGRAGALIAWGAPWNERIFGFVGEAGLSVGAAGPIPLRCDDWCPSGKGRVTKVYASPYASASLIAQAPLPVARPYLALNVAFLPVYYDGPIFFHTLELGLAWQAW